MNIVTISGGISSAWVAYACKQILKKETIYYFNDTKWEHPDLYRFLEDCERVIGIEIIRDNDGRNPEEVFRDQHMLGNNRAPLCSKILKAQRLQKRVKKGDILYFGIDRGELKRAARISAIYARLECECRFPIIDAMITQEEMKKEIISLGIKIPELYEKGFKHNNCHGGCVRAGIKQWQQLFEIYPDVYRDRERVEVEFNKPKWTAYTFIKGISLTQLRERIEEQKELPFDDDTWHGECVGICDVMN